MHHVGFLKQPCTHLHLDDVLLLTLWTLARTHTGPVKSTSKPSDKTGCLTHSHKPTNPHKHVNSHSKWATHTHFFFSPWDTRAPYSRKLCQDHVRLGRHTWTHAATGLTLWAGEYTLKIMFAFTRANHLREQHHTLPTTHHFTSSHCFHHICQSCSHSTALWVMGLSSLVGFCRSLSAGESQKNTKSETH